MPAFYARPTRELAGAVSASAVARVRARQRELGVPESFEWVADTTPTLRAAVEVTGLAVGVPSDGARLRRAGARCEGVADASSVRVIGPDDPEPAGAVAAQHLAFAEPGTGIGSAGVTELAEATRVRAGDGSVDRVIARLKAGLASVAAATEEGMALSAGQHQPLGTVSEIVGVGTLPAARRRGLGLAVTAALVADARSRGVETVFLTADDDDVAASTPDSASDGSPPH